MPSERRAHARPFPAAVLLLLASLLFWNMEAQAKPLKDILGVSDLVVSLDQSREDLSETREDISKVLEDNPLAHGQFMLRDLEFFTHMASLELHNIVDVFMLTEMHDEPGSFKKAKTDELRAKMDASLADLKRRDAYVLLIDPYYACEDLKPKILRYAKQADEQMKLAIKTLQEIRKALD